MVDARRVDARATQGVALQVQRLGAVGLGDPSVTDQHVSQTRVWDMEVSMMLAACLCARIPFRISTFSKRQTEGRKDGTQAAAASCPGWPFRSFQRRWDGAVTGVGRNICNSTRSAILYSLRR